MIRRSKKSKGFEKKLFKVDENHAGALSANQISN
jgi:hypothetical protein